MTKGRRLLYSEYNNMSETVLVIRKHVLPYAEIVNKTIYTILNRLY